MKVGGVARRTLWADGEAVKIIDQTALPHRFVIRTVHGVEEMAEAIRTMRVRGAPLIGASAAWGMALAAREDPTDDGLARAAELLRGTRPTAVNLGWAVDRCLSALQGEEESRRAERAWALAEEVAEEDVACNRALGEHALGMIRQIAGARQDPSAPLRILTHCNAGWLATVDVGTATAGIYAAFDAGLDVHVWVDETRPRGQGARLTAWELGQHGVPHTVIPDVAAGHLMASGRVELVLVGTDRTTATGDVVNKIGTYGVALAARDNGVPFYVAAPSPSLDFRVDSGRDVPIEEREGDEVHWVAGVPESGAPVRVRVTPAGSPAANPAFDVTPARLVTGIITERGVAPATREGLAALFPERAGLPPLYP